MQAARERYAVARGKSDGFDAYVLAELARTDMHRLRLLVPDNDETKALRALVRTREDLVAQRVALANQLRAQLEAHWPGAARIFDARGLGERRLAGFLAHHRYRGRRSPAELLARLRAAPTGRAGELELEARRAALLALAAALRPLVEQIDVLASQIAGALRAHPDGEIFLSLLRDPKAVVTAATLLAEIGNCRARYPNAETPAANTGMSAAAVESGKRKSARFRQACDKRLRNTVATLADASRHRHPWAADIYTRARARDCDHPHALRALGRA